MTPATRHVTQTECDARHGVTKAKLALLSAIVIGMLVVPGAAACVAWTAGSEARSNSLRIAAQSEMLRQIHEDVREIRATQIQQLRNGQP